VTLVDRELHCASELALEASEMLDDGIADRPGPVIELDGRCVHRAAVREARAHRPVHPMLEQRAQPRQSALCLQSRHEDGFGEAGSRGFDRSDLQFFARSEMGEQSALRHPRPVRKRADRE
jgi:hypothetical protein